MAVDFSLESLQQLGYKVRSHFFFTERSLFLNIKGRSLPHPPHLPHLSTALDTP
ncbi:hypothetical protein [Nostoc sp. DSM 114167]|uniref:hypothetical protein n=1 Tax=Nostoc sp. DSM 114167 TaxID=3439050 RepID=UPI004046837E